jgi:Cdc6-like AAA superfamily ATPase
VHIHYLKNETADSGSKLSQAIRDDTAFIKTTIPVLTAGVESVRESQDEQRYRLIVNWLSSTDFPAQQSDFIRSRQEGTGLWFVGSPKFTSWLQGTKQTLFCPGIPGAGKTMIAAIAVDYLWKTFQNDNVGIASVYCSYKGQESQTTTELVAAILKQLIQERPMFGEPVAALYKRHADRRTRPSLDEILTALNSVINCYSKVYIILDGLDECTDSNGTRSEFLANLHSLQTKTGTSLMATSRFVPRIAQSFKGFPVLEIRAKDADVKQFVAGQMNRLPNCVQRNIDLQLEIQDRIVQAVDGM